VQGTGTVSKFRFSVKGGSFHCLSLLEGDTFVYFGDATEQLTASSWRPALSVPLRNHGIQLPSTVSLHTTKLLRSGLLPSPPPPPPPPPPCGQAPKKNGMLQRDGNIH
jgi:hypothetical protein